MNVILAAINVVACAAIFWVCGTFLLVGARADCMRRALLQLALLISMVGGFTSAVATASGSVIIPWWMVALHVGIAALALFGYDQSFGIARQVRNARERVAALPVKLQQWWIERLAIAEQHARRRRH